MDIAKCRIAFIGAGNMGAALIEGLLDPGGLSAGHLTAADPRQVALQPLAALGVRTVGAAGQALSGQDVIVVAVKPQVAAPVLAELAGGVRDGQLVVSVMAGTPTAWLESQLPPGVPVIRAMPQMLARLGAGATVLCSGERASGAHLALARQLFERVGTTAVVPERLMDAATGLAGSGPAYVYTILQALTDAGVRVGLPRDIAQILTAQTLIGAARMVLERGGNPAALRDQVTSPGGTTIAGLFELEAGGVRAALMRAVQAATERSRELGTQ